MVQSLCHSTPHETQAGTALIEVMVAVVIVLFGIIGYVTSVNYSLKSVRSSLFSTQASVYAQNVAEVTRFNPQSNGVAAVGTPTQNITGAVVNCMTADCDEDQMLRYHIYRIYCNVNPAIYNTASLPCTNVIAGGVAGNVAARGVSLPNARLTISSTLSTLTINGIVYESRAFQPVITWDDVIGVWDAATKSWVVPVAPGTVHPTRQEYSMSTRFYWPQP